MKPPPIFTKSELEDLHSVLRRAAERCEKEKRFEDARKIAEEAVNIEIEIERAE